MKRAALIFALYLFAAVAYFHEAFTGRLLLAEGDGLLQYYPILGHVVEIYRSGELPLWTSRIFAGFPLMAASHYSVLYPVEMLPALALPTDIAYNLNIVVHIALAGTFTTLLIMETGLGLFPSFFGGLVYAFTGYLVPHIQHVPVLNTAAWLPLILFFIEKLRKDVRIEYAFFASFAIALQTLAGHPQVLLYSLTAAGAYALYAVFAFLPPGRRLRFAVMCLMAAALGLLIASPQLYATHELAKQGVRGEISYKDFASYSLTPGVLPSMLLPWVFGRGEAYFSVAALLLAIAAAVWGFRVERRLRFWAAMGLAAFILALGDTLRPLHRLMYHVPLFGMFRGSVRHLVELNLAVGMLAAFGLSATLKRIKTPRWHRMIAALAFVALALEVHAYRAGGWISIEKVEAYVPESLSSLGAMNERTAFMTKSVVPYLMLGKGVNVLNGYDPMIIADFGTLLEMGGVGGVPLNKERVLRNNLALSMFNARFVFIDSADEPLVETVRAGRWGDGSWGRPQPAQSDSPGYMPLYRKLHSERGIALYENLNTAPRAFSVERLVPVKNTPEVWGIVYSLDTNPQEVAAMSPEDIREIGDRRFTKGDVLITDYSHLRVVMRVRLSGEGFVVLSDQFYPGWRAYVDGIETKIYKVNGVMRGVAVTRGGHEAVFRYAPVKIYALMGVSAVTALALAGWLAWRRIRRRKR